MTEERIDFNYDLQPVEKSICDASILEILLYYLNMFFKRLVIKQE